MCLVILSHILLLNLLNKICYVYGDELRRILTFISDLTHNDTNSTVKDTQITAKANVPFKEIR